MPELGKTSHSTRGEIARQERDRDLARPDWFSARDPFAEAMRRFSEAFDAFPFFSGSTGRGSTSMAGWRPQVEAFNGATNSWSAPTCPASRRRTSRWRSGTTPW